jgi:hypothetical protein
MKPADRSVNDRHFGPGRALMASTEPADWDGLAVMLSPARLKLQDNA